MKLVNSKTNKWDIFISCTLILFFSASMAIAKNKNSAKFKKAPIGKTGSAPKMVPFNQGYWKGESSGFLIHWDSQDLTVKRKMDGELVYSAKAEIESELTKGNPRKKGKKREKIVSCQYEKNINLLAVVGPFISVQEELYNYCRGWSHPIEEIKYRTIDLNKVANLKPGKYLEANVNLMDLFSDREISQSLRNDPILKKSMHEKLPEGLQELVLLFASKSVPRNSYCFRVPQDMLTRFAFFSSDGKFTSVRLALPGNDHCRANLTQVGLRLGLQKPLKVVIQEVISSGDGLFMAQANQRLGGATKTKFEFDYLEEVDD